MDQNIEKFRNWFEKKNPRNGKRERIVIRENAREDNVKIAQILPEQKIYSMFRHDEKAKIGTACIGYGYGYGTVPSFGKQITITHQNHYEETPLWRMDVSRCLGGSPQNPEAAGVDTETWEAAQNGKLIKWMIQPQGNQEIAGDIFKMLIYPVLSAVCDKIPGRNHKEIDLVLPLISETMEEPNWEQLLGSFRLENTQVRIHPYAHLIWPEAGERCYSFVVHSDGDEGYYIADITEQLPSGEPVSVGAYAFTPETIPGEYIPLKIIRERTVEISGVIHKNKQTVTSAPLNPDILAECRLEEISSLKSFLGTHTPSFYKDFFTAKEKNAPSNPLQKKISVLLSNRQSLQTAQICAELCHSDNLLNIALSDMVTAASLLEDTRFFSTTTISNRGQASALVTDMSILGRQEVPLGRIPSNFGEITWECTAKRYAAEDWWRSTTDQLKKMSIDDVLNMEYCCFSQECTTDELADELLYAFHKKGTPTARFVAELFWHLLNSDQFQIKSKSTPVQDYQILETKNEIIKIPQNEKGNQGNYAREKFYKMPLEKLRLSLKTQLILQRAGIRTVGDIAGKSELEITKIRNLGQKSRLEVQRALARLKTEGASK